ncbi:bifunctional UDP-sugar hydrolase/5'-nucleotidase [Brachybacterium sp. YJGR34]|uniref:bifunctional metallophosphatase/5'-nucleotidase n=1 Tax=Brachybacterium sp. YJGR34 TaxID=2059911 RepID=UPI000E0A383C|nr:metallophosphoesterase [Brachybacterium sp. YJGR34]
MTALSRRRLVTAALTVGLLAPAASAVAAPSGAQGAKLTEGRRFALTIMHTNDLHGHLRETVTGKDGQPHENNVAKYATLIDQVRDEEENVLVLDAGDLFLRGEFETFQGALETEILKEIGFDATVIGNNDFRVFPAGSGTAEDSYEQMKDYQRTLNFPILLGNVVVAETGKHLSFTKPHVTQNLGGVKVGIIGLTSMKPEQREWEDVETLDFIDPVDALEGGLIEEVGAKADVTVALSHAGNPDDHRIAQVAGVDAVIGGDSHIVLRTPETELNPEGHTVPITAGGGEQEHYLGRLDLTFEVQGGSYVLIDHSGFLYEDLSAVEEDPAIVALIEEYREELSAP